MKLKTFAPRITRRIILLIALSLGITAQAQQVFTNGIDLAYSYVSNIALVAEAGSSTNLGTLGQAISVGQLSGNDPQTGEMITNSADLLPFVGQSLVLVDTNGLDAVVVTPAGMSAPNVAAGNLSTYQLDFISGTNTVASIYPSNGVLSVSGGLGGDASGLTVNGESLDSIISNLQQQADAVYANGAIVMVQATTNGAQNGLNLLAAYAEAKTKSPSANNRIAVVLPPGTYDLGSSTLNMDTTHIDVCGLVETPVTAILPRGAQLLAKPPAVIESTAGFAINMTGSTDSMVRHISVLDGEIRTGVDATAAGNTLYHVYAGGGIDYDHSYARYLHCWGYLDSFSGDAWQHSPNPQREGLGPKGYYYACIAGDDSFSGSALGCDCSGVFLHCSGGYGGFGISGSASGIFINCVAGDESFGEDEASGTFINCQGGSDSFGWRTASGTFTDCQAGEYSFGYRLASGTFTDCQAGGWSFGSGSCPGSLSTNAVLVNCSAGLNSFGDFDMAAENFSYNASGHTLAGGPITGDGSGLTNLNVANLLGIIPTNNLPAEALQSGGASDWAQLAGIPSGFSDGVDNVLADTDVASMGYIKVDTDTQLDESQVDVYVANNGYALSSNIYTKAETDSAITNALVGSNMDLSNIGVYGDLGMGSFTNSSTSN